MSSSLEAKIVVLGAQGESNNHPTISYFPNAKY